MRKPWFKIRLGKKRPAFRKPADIRDFTEEDAVNWLSTLEEIPCPGELTREILRMTVESPAKRKRSVRVPLSFRIPAALAGAALAVLLLVVTVNRESREPISQTSITEVGESNQNDSTMTEEEKREAAEKIKWSLAYTAQLLDKSEKEAIGEAVMQELPETLRSTLKRAVPLLQGGAQ